MKEILIALIAIIVYTVIMPILDSISGFIQSYFNKQIHGWQMDMTVDEAHAHATAESLSAPPTNTNAIGFEVASTCDCNE